VLKCAEQSCGMGWCVARDQRTVRWEDRYRLALAASALVVLSTGSAAVPVAAGRFGPSKAWRSQHLRLLEPIGEYVAKSRLEEEQ
jgi:hypothetical protein